MYKPMPMIYFFCQHFTWIGTSYCHTYYFVQCLNWFQLSLILHFMNFVCELVQIQLSDKLLWGYGSHFEQYSNIFICCQWWLDDFLQRFWFSALFKVKLTLNWPNLSLFNFNMNWHISDHIGHPRGQMMDLGNVWNKHNN